MSDLDPKPTPTMTLDVDAANPGQFFACCGLLELASRLDEEALGWFEAARFCIHMDTQHSVFDSVLELSSSVIMVETSLKRLEELARKLKRLKKEKKKLIPSEEAELKSLQKERRAAPINLTICEKSLRLDWWFDSYMTHAGLKTWGGGQTVYGFVDGMQQHLIDWDGSAESMLVKAFATAPPKPFYFDSRVSRLTAIDMGFSTEQFAATFSPATELLALVGLQRFRPFTVEHRQRYGYCTWKEPLPLRIATATVQACVPALIDTSFTFPLVIRTGDKYKAFGPSTHARSDHA